MTRGDKWNWAFTTTAIVQSVVYLQEMRLQVLFAWVGGYHHSVSQGLAVIGLPFIVALLVWVVVGCATVCRRVPQPLMGVAIGAALYFPLLVVPLQAWPASALALLAIGLLKKPKQKNTDSNKASEDIGADAPNPQR